VHDYKNSCTVHCTKVKVRCSGTTFSVPGTVPLLASSRVQRTVDCNKYIVLCGSSSYSSMIQAEVRAVQTCVYVHGVGAGALMKRAMF